MADKIRKAFFTIVSKNYLHFARTLMQSLRRVHPEWDQYVLLVDEIGDDFNPAAESFKIVEVTSLPLPEMRKFLFRYTILELNTAVKPFMFELLFHEERYDQVIYLDPDIYAYRSLSEAIHALDSGHLMVGTPHLTGELADDKKPSELDILNCGTFNLGFIGLANHIQLDSFLDWWKQKLEFDCVVDIPRGIFVDQRWIDLVPGIFGDCFLLRHEGYNVAYWNLAHRKVARAKDGFTVNGCPLVFFHFSGLNPLDPSPVSKHQNRFKLEDLGDAVDLVKSYAGKVIANGMESCSTWKYSFGHFHDGTGIVDVMRGYYRRNAELQQAAGDDPFQMDYRWFNLPWGSTPKGEPPISILMRCVWESRPDLQEHFPDIEGKHRYNFAYWFLNSGKIEHHIPSVFLEPISKLISDSAPTPATGIGRGIVKAAYWMDPIVRHFPSSMRDKVKNRLFSRQEPIDTTASPEASLGLRIDYEGFYDLEGGGDSGDAVWMGKVGHVKIMAGLVGRLTIEGEYDALPYTRMKNESDMEIDVLLDGVPIGTLTLHQSGPFRESIPVTVPKRQVASVLALRASQTFVPARLGINDDMRELSVRISKILVDDVAVLDFSCPESPFMSFSRDLAVGFGVNVIGYVKSEHGVGQSLRNCSLALEAAHIPFTLIDFEIGNLNRKRDETWADRVSSENPHLVNLFHINADQMSLAASHFGQQFFDGHYNIGYWHWELPEFPDRWVNGFSHLHELWAPSQFVLEAISRKSPVPVIRIPHAIHFTPDLAVKRSHMGLPENIFLFLMMYDMHSYQTRKNPEAVIKAFHMAFPQNDNVGLVIKTHNTHTYPDEFQRLREQVRDIGGVILLDRMLTRQEVYNLENLCDCFVSLHRSEGFGLGLAECMFLGKPVIGTNWSSNVDFMNYKNSCPVDYSLVRLEKDYGPYKRGQVWAEPDVEHAAWYMRTLVADAQWRDWLSREGQATIRSSFSPLAVGRIIEERLKLISRW